MGEWWRRSRAAERVFGPILLLCLDCARNHYHGSVILASISALYWTVLERNLLDPQANFLQPQWPLDWPHRLVQATGISAYLGGFPRIIRGYLVLAGLFAGLFAVFLLYLRNRASLR